MKNIEHKLKKISKLMDDKCVIMIGVDAKNDRIDLLSVQAVGEENDDITYIG